MCVIFLFFFFQAEDGIRDLTVTGVQTCALPICSAAEGAAEVLADLDGRDKEILLERSADVLKAFEHLAFKALRLEPAYHEKIHIDCGGEPPPPFAGIKGTARIEKRTAQTPVQSKILIPRLLEKKKKTHVSDV